MSVDPETVTLQGTYRIGFMPPVEGSLTAGELYIEVGAGAPKLWVGAMIDAGFAGGLAVLATAEAAPLVPPVNRDVPYVSQEGSILSCTMGNWDGSPTDYTYQWQLDAGNIGDGTASYTVLPEDAGKTAVCVVSATNAAGTTVAPPSNPVVVAPPPAGATAAAPSKPAPAPETKDEDEPKSSKR